MKKTILTLSTITLVIGNVTSGCNGSHESKPQSDHEQHQVEAVYQCSMKCEANKIYHKAGKCPVCGMDLKKMDNHHEH